MNALDIKNLSKAFFQLAFISRLIFGKFDFVFIISIFVMVIKINIMFIRNQLVIESTINQFHLKMSKIPKMTFGWITAKSYHTS